MQTEAQRRFFLAFMGFLLLFLTACGEVSVRQNITQEQANEIVAVLNRNGIFATAEKQTGVGDSYNVEVKQSHYAVAIDLLDRKNLPAEPAERFSDLITQRGLLPDSRDEEAMRLDHALGLQLQELLQTVPGVISSRAVVRANFLDVDSKSSASVVVQLRKGAVVDRSDLTQLIARTIPGLDSERVHLSTYDRSISDEPLVEEGVLHGEESVIRVPLTKFLFGWRVSEEDYNGLAISLVAFIILIACLGAVVGYWYGYMQQGPKQLFDEDFSDPRAGAFRLEDQSKHLPEE